MAEDHTVLSKNAVTVEIFTQKNPRAEKHTKELVQLAINHITC